MNITSNLPKYSVLAVSLILTFAAQQAVQAQVFRSDGSETTWDPIFETSDCTATPLVGMDDPRWSQLIYSQAIAFANISTGEGIFPNESDPLHPWQVFEPQFTGMPEARWINAWRNAYDPNDPLDKPFTSVGHSGVTVPDGKVAHNHFTKYQRVITGTGTFDLLLLGDNCAWVYLDGLVVGNQLGGNIAQTYLLGLSGTHTLTFVIYDSGGLAGGMYELKTNTDTNPPNPDRDGDGIPNDAEVNIYNTDPDNPDSDGDGIDDGDEVANGTDPNDASDPVPPDTDNDGMPDSDELLECVGSTWPDVAEDSLKPNRWRFDDDEDVQTFVQGATKGKGGGRGRGGNAGYTMESTGGCSCEQIIVALDLGEGHSKWGCSNSAMAYWADYVSGVSGKRFSGASLTGFRETDLQLIEVPTEFMLEGNYPNPFNPQTTIRFGLAETAEVSLVVYDVMGREVQVLVRGTLSAGMHEANFDATSLPSGAYLYRLVTPTYEFSKIMMLLK